MKVGALATIIVSELLILMLTSLNINSNSISFVSTLVVVVVVAFSFSALLQNIKTLASSKKYGISGVIGVIAGILYFWLTSKHFETIVAWLHKYGVSILLVVILICVIYLFQGKKSKA
ncbi:hypothetical protein [Wenyingzhuangia aestuarii]|uniref:hypothetical protein n=1 Tax=Wenyingzhuangia aestuarii TaxID=1647582 RepID=UPI001439DF6C|nr:hypothetical protein [Wenyingzhuangia aestuarii]NJB83292.1 multidrug transporter EmrE-like cation transporter [Wenyingzhuangia aestuarii]